MDALLLALGNVASQLLPIIGAVALVFLCIVLNKLVKLLESLTKTVDSLDPTLKKVDLSIDKVQAPLDTVVKLSHSFDDVSSKTSSGLEKASSTIIENVDKLKAFVNDKMAKTKHNYSEIVDDAVEVAHKVEEKVEEAINDK